MTNDRADYVTYTASILTHTAFLKQEKPDIKIAEAIPKILKNAGLKVPVGVFDLLLKNSGDAIFEGKIAKLQVNLQKGTNIEHAIYDTSNNKSILCMSSKSIEDAITIPRWNPSIDPSIDGSMNGSMDRSLDGSIDGWMEGSMGRSIDGSMDGSMDGYVNGWID